MGTLVLPILPASVEPTADVPAGADTGILGLKLLGNPEPYTTVWQFDPSADQGFLFGWLAEWGGASFSNYADRLQIAINTTYSAIFGTSAYLLNSYADNIQTAVNVTYPTTMVNY